MKNQKKNQKNQTSVHYNDISQLGNFSFSKLYK